MRNVGSCGGALFLLISLLFLASCHKASDHRSAKNNICDVDEKPQAYFGQKLTLAGTFITDSATFTVLKSHGCADDEFLKVANPPGNASVSVNEFFKVVRSRCVAICLVKARVVVEGVVDTNADNQVVFRPTDIIEYEFLEEGEAK